jgi:hypothetical protein
MSTAVATNRTYPVSVDLLAGLYGDDLPAALDGEIPAAWNPAFEAPDPPASAPLLAYRRRVAPYMRFSTPRYVTRCAHCRMPWGPGNRQGRSVRYAETGAGGEVGMFVVCRWCWGVTTAAQRFVYAFRVVFFYRPRYDVPVDRCVADWPAVAVAYGGIPDATAPFGYRPPEAS